MKLILVRHGETDWNAIGKLQGGDSDIPLNDRGKDQAQRAAQSLKDEKIDVTFASPQIRARQTAEIINEFHDHGIIIDNRLIERKYGKLEGTPYVDLNANMRRLKEEDSYQENEVEYYKHFKTRVGDFWFDIKGSDYGKTILVVSHSSVTKVILSAILEKPIKEIRQSVIKRNCSISTIEFDKNKRVIRMEIGRDDHLK